MSACNPLGSTRSVLLESRARQMRAAPTEPERRLWLALRAGQLGVAFRRQVVIGERYIVDLLAPRARLVVEVDGSQHARRAAADARRDARLRRHGYRVLRLEAQLVLRHPEVALARIREALGQG